MKKLMTLLVAMLTALAGQAALPQPDLIAEIHFAGGSRIAADKNYAPFTNEFSSPEALALRKQTADKLAPWLAGWLQQKLGATVPNGAAKLRPLFDDLQAAEWLLEARAAANGKPDVALAIRVDTDRMQVWQEGLKPFFTKYAFKQAGGWLIFDSGTGATKADDRLMQNISAPPSGWLNLDVNWPHLAQWYPVLKSLGLPETLFNVTAPDRNLRINGKFFFPQNLSLKLDPWQFPTNTIHQPLTSFTAVRGFAGWLSGQDWAQPIKLSPPANQLFTWALNGAPFQSYAAVPVADSAEAFRRLDANLQPIVAGRNAHDGFVAPLTLDVMDNQMALIGMPILAPYIRTLNGPSGQFLIVGGMPNLPKGRPLPAEIFQQLAIPNLIYYHWEITTERLLSQLQVDQLSLMWTKHQQIDTSSAGFQWISKFGPTLGNTVTQITQTAPDQLSFTRATPGGLTAFELFALAGWLETADFPHYNLNLPVMSERLKNMRVKNHNPIMLPVPAH